MKEDKLKMAPAFKSDLRTPDPGLLQQLSYATPTPARPSSSKPLTARGSKWEISRV